jgi:hypothetical protein
MNASPKRAPTESETKIKITDFSFLSEMLIVKAPTKENKLTKATLISEYIIIIFI